jgi:hypothetical protein
MKEMMSETEKKDEKEMTMRGKKAKDETRE